jgi:hypothetical protein
MFYKYVFLDFLIKLRVNYPQLSLITVKNWFILFVLSPRTVIRRSLLPHSICSLTPHTVIRRSLLPRPRGPGPSSSSVARGRPPRPGRCRCAPTRTRACMGTAAARCRWATSCGSRRGAASTRTARRSCSPAGSWCPRPPLWRRSSSRCRWTGSPRACGTPHGGRRASPPLRWWWCWSPCSMKCRRGTRYPRHRAAGPSYVLLLLCIIGPPVR